MINAQLMHPFSSVNLNTGGNLYALGSSGYSDHANEFENGWMPAYKKNLLDDSLFVVLWLIIVSDDSDSLWLPGI